MGQLCCMVGQGLSCDGDVSGGGGGGMGVICIGRDFCVVCIA